MQSPSNIARLNCEWRRLKYEARNRNGNKRSRSLRRNQALIIYLTVSLNSMTNQLILIYVAEQDQAP